MPKRAKYLFIYLKREKNVSRKIWSNLEFLKFDKKNGTGFCKIDGFEDIYLRTTENINKKTNLG